MSIRMSWVGTVLMESCKVASRILAWHSKRECNKRLLMARLRAEQIGRESIHCKGCVAENGAACKRGDVAESSLPKGTSGKDCSVL